jgi:hypothetical protein
MEQKAVERRAKQEAEAPQRKAEKAVRDAEFERWKESLLALDEQVKDRRLFEGWLADEERRLAQGLCPEDEWDEESVADLRADLDRLCPGDEAMRVRVERFIESVCRVAEDENVDIFRAKPPACMTMSCGHIALAVNGTVRRLRTATLCRSLSLYLSLLNRLALARVHSPVHLHAARHVCVGLRVSVLLRLIPRYHRNRRVECNRYLPQPNRM